MECLRWLLLCWWDCTNGVFEMVVCCVGGIVLMECLRWLLLCW